jgi:hypothetical protein
MLFLGKDSNKRARKMKFTSIFLQRVQSILFKDSNKRARKMKFTSLFLQRVQSILFKDSASRVINKQACLIFLSELSCQRVSGSLLTLATSAADSRRRQFAAYLIKI